jgi:hypothetical protein
MNELSLSFDKRGREIVDGIVENKISFSYFNGNFALFPR